MRIHRTLLAAAAADEASAVSLLRTVGWSLKRIRAAVWLHSWVSFACGGREGRGEGGESNGVHENMTKTRLWDFRGM